MYLLNDEQEEKPNRGLPNTQFRLLFELRANRRGGLTMSDNLIHGTDDSFDQLVISSDTPVLVDFWAPWCGPCQVIGPILEELADEYAGRAKIVKINVDEEQSVAGAMGVRSIPTLVLFKDGKALQNLVGVKPKEELKKLLDQALG